MRIGRIGSIVGPVVGGIVLALNWSIAEIFLVTAVPALIAALGVLMLKLLAAGSEGRPLPAPRPAAE